MLAFALEASDAVLIEGPKWCGKTRTANSDLSRVDGIEKNPARVRAIMHSLARNVSTTASLTTIRDDVVGFEGTISEKTVSSYITALRKIYVVEDLPAWSPSMRSKTAIRTSPKRHFTDPSIATTLLRAAT